MKKLLLLIPFITFGQDKKDLSDAYHVYASAGITHVVGNLVYYKTDKIGLSTFTGMASAFAVGLGKEYIWDKKLGKGVFNKQDIFFNGWGCLLGGVTFRVVIDIRDSGLKKRKDKYEY